MTAAVILSIGFGQLSMGLGLLNLLRRVERLEERSVSRSARAAT